MSIFQIQIYRIKTVAVVMVKVRRIPDFRQFSVGIHRASKDY
jgi:hypothetical protein